MNLNKTECKYLLNLVSKRVQEAHDLNILLVNSDTEMVLKWTTELHSKLQREYYR